MFSEAMTPRISTLVHLATLLVVSTQVSTPFPSHCLVRQSSDPKISSSDCQTAIDQFLNEHPSSASIFSNQPSSSNDTIMLPWDHTSNGCELRIELIYAHQVQASTDDIILAGDALDNACVGHPEYLGGRIFLNEQGLTLSLRPSVEVAWEERFNQSSVVAGTSSNSIASPTLYTVTGTAGSTF